jgi:hypothetical protein
MLDHFQPESSRFRTWNGTRKLVVGSLSIPAGIFVLGRGGDLPGAVLLGNGAVAIGGGLLDFFFFKEPFEELRSNFLRRSTAMPASAAVFETEQEWYDKARTARRVRFRTGLVATGAGLVLIGLGSAVAFADVDIPSKVVRSEDRGVYASLCFGFGGLSLSSGIRTLLLEDPIESSWQGYARARKAWAAMPSLQIMASPSTLGAGLSGAF